ncbi:MAG: hypothetical protein ACKO7V_13580, partial [Bacteroidota bacterium]
MTILLFFIICLIYKNPNWRKRFLRIFWWIVGFIPLFLLGRIFDWTRYGSFWMTGKIVEELQITTDPMWQGMPQLPEGFPVLNSPHVGIFGALFAPAK